MTDEIERRETYLGEVDQILIRNAAVGEDHDDELQRLRGEIEQHCRAGDYEQADRCKKLLVDIIRTGQASPE